MPQRIIVYWKDIPAQVIIRAGRRNTAKRQLSERFEQAIDMAAMRAGQRDSDDYLEQWRRSEPEDIEGEDLEQLADLELASIETEYDAGRLKRLIENQGVAD